MVSTEDPVVKPKLRKDVRRQARGLSHSADIAQHSESTLYDRTTRSVSTHATARLSVASSAATLFSKLASAIQAYWLPGQRNSDRMMRESNRKARHDEETDDVQK